MISLISAVNKQQKQLLISKLFVDITRQVYYDEDTKAFFTIKVIKQALLSLCLFNRRFTVKITAKSGRRYTVFTYRTTCFHRQQFEQGVERFLISLFDAQTVTEKQTQRTFSYLKRTIGYNIKPSVFNQYLLPIERVVVLNFLNQIPLISGG